MSKPGMKDPEAGSGEQVWFGICHFTRSLIQTPPELLPWLGVVLVQGVQGEERPGAPMKDVSLTGHGDK